MHSGTSLHFHCHSEGVLRTCSTRAQWCATWRRSSSSTRSSTRPCPFFRAPLGRCARLKLRGRTRCSSACKTRQDAVLFCRVTRALHHCGGVQQPAKITSLSSCGPTRCERLATPSLNRCWLTQGWALPCWCSGICSVPPLRPLSVGALLFCLMRRGRARARARAWTHGPAPSATSILFACPANDPSAAFELGLR